MKRYNPLFCFFLLGLVSCAQELTLENGSDPARTEIRINGIIDQQLATRADDNGFYDGDAFGVYITDNNNSIADNVRFVYDAASASWVPDTPVYFTNPDMNVSITGYYPYKDNLDNPSAFHFEVSRDQRKPAANGLLGGYEASDFLYAIRRDVKPTSEVISLLFKHRLANFKVTLLKGAGWSDEEWNQVSKDVLVTNTIRQSVIDLSDGSVQTEGSDRSMGIVPMDMGNDVWRAVVVPQEVPAGSPILSITIDGQPREFTYDGVYRYYEGKQNSLTLSVNKNPGYQGIDLELLSEGITPWEDDATVREETSKDYLVIRCPEGGKLKESIQNEGYQLESIKNLKVEGTLNADDFYFMRDELPILQAVNLMEVRIEPCYMMNYDDKTPDCIPDEAFAEKQSLMKVVFPKTLSRIGYRSFYKTSLKGDLVFPEGFTSIGYYAFESISTLNGSAIFPDTIREIKDGAFYQTTLRGELNLPEGLDRICYLAFGGTDISAVTLPSSLTYLGEGAFRECYKMKGAVDIPPKVKTIGLGCFAQDVGIKGILHLSEGLESIAEVAFTGCQFTGPLVVPSTVKYIDYFAFENNRFSSISLPESLERLGEGAFARNGELLTEAFDLKVPDGITVIPAQCFRNLCIRALSLGKNTELIGQNAFSNCSYISSIVCEALQPPTLEDGAFDGVPKDNFAVEVPESAVGLYQKAPGWKEFKRIVAHRDFSISRRLLRTLNKAASEAFLLRAESGASWTVQNKPDWVTVSPSSGTGKTEVTVSVSTLARGSGNREGEIVFRLSGKDYVVSTKVEQYDYQYGDGDVYPVQTHKKGLGVRLVFMGDCYDAKDICEGKYLDNTLEAVEHFFAIEPYNTYRDYFDVHVVFGCSEDSGIGDVNTIRTAKFGSQYSLTEGVMFDDAACLAYAAKVHPLVSSIAGICMTLNADLEDGATYLYDNDLFISLCPVSQGPYPQDFRGVVQHEAGGHGFGKLGDETIQDPSFLQICTIHYPAFITAKAHGWYDNLSMTGDMHKVLWSHFIYDSKYSDFVDVYEGGFYHARGVFRSEANSCMRNKIPYYSTISRESIVKRIMRYAGVPYRFDSFKANDVTGASTGSRSSVEWEIPELDSGRHREPVLKGASPVIDTNR